MRKPKYRKITFKTVDDLKKFQDEIYQAVRLLEKYEMMVICPGCYDLNAQTAITFAQDEELFYAMAQNLTVEELREYDSFYASGFMCTAKTKKGKPCGNLGEVGGCASDWIKGQTDRCHLHKE